MFSPCTAAAAISGDRRYRHYLSVELVQSICRTGIVLQVAVFGSQLKCFCACNKIRSSDEARSVERLP